VLARLFSLVVRRLEVVGPSMIPTYAPGERVSAVRKWRRVRVGDVVALVDPGDPQRFLLKRCVQRHGSKLDVRGDNAAISKDSREFGLVASSSVKWIVVNARPLY
jgi:phage repressor protein C with HTH and peptisase S24 domain